MTHNHFSCACNDNYYVWYRISGFHEYISIPANATSYPSRRPITLCPSQPLVSLPEGDSNNHVYAYGVDFTSGQTDEFRPRYLIAATGRWSYFYRFDMAPKPSQTLYMMDSAYSLNTATPGNQVGLVTIMPNRWGLNPGVAGFHLRHADAGNALAMDGSAAARRHEVFANFGIDWGIDARGDFIYR